MSKKTNNGSLLLGTGLVVASMILVPALAVRLGLGASLTGALRIALMKASNRLSAVRVMFLKRPDQRGVVILRKLFGTPRPTSGKNCVTAMHSATPVVLLHSLHTRKGMQLGFALTRCGFAKPAFSLREKHLEAVCQTILLKSRIFDDKLRNGVQK